MAEWEIKTRKLITQMNRCVTESVPGNKERERERRKKGKKNSVQLK